MYRVLKEKLKQSSEMTFYILEENLEKKRGVFFYPCGMKSGPGYIMTTLYEM